MFSQITKILRLVIHVDQFPAPDLIQQLRHKRWCLCMWRQDLKNITDAAARSFKPRLHHRHGSQMLLLLIISPPNADKERRLLCEDASGCFVRSVNEVRVFCGEDSVA